MMRDEPDSYVGYEVIFARYEQTESAACTQPPFASDHTLTGLRLTGGLVA